MTHFLLPHLDLQNSVQYVGMDAATRGVMQGETE